MEEKMIYKTTPSLKIRAFLGIVIFLILFTVSLVNLLVFLLVLSSHQYFTLGHLFRDNNIFFIILFSTLAIFSIIVIIKCIKVLYQSKYFKIIISEGFFTYYSHKNRKNDFKIEDMTVRYVINRATKSWIYIDFLLFVRERNNYNIEIELNCGLMGKIKFEEMLKLIISHGAKFYVDTDVISEDLEYINSQDTELDNKWKCGKCGTLNDIYLDTCRICGKRFGKLK